MDKDDVPLEDEEEEVAAWVEEPPRALMESDGLGVEEEVSVVDVVVDDMPRAWAAKSLRSCNINRCKHDRILTVTHCTCKVRV